MIKRIEKLYEEGFCEVLVKESQEWLRVLSLCDYTEGIHLENEISYHSSALEAVRSKEEKIQSFLTEDKEPYEILVGGGWLTVHWGEKRTVRTIGGGDYSFADIDNIRKKEDKIESIKEKIERLSKQGPCEIFIKEDSTGRERYEWIQIRGGKYIDEEEVHETLKLGDNMAKCWSYRYIEDVRLVSNEHELTYLKRGECEAYVNTKIYPDKWLPVNEKGSYLNKRGLDIADPITRCCDYFSCSTKNVRGEIKEIRLVKEEQKSDFKEGDNITMDSKTYKISSVTQSSDEKTELKLEDKEPHLPPMTNLTFGPILIGSAAKVGTKIKISDIKFDSREKRSLIGRELTIKEIDIRSESCFSTGRHWWKISEFSVLEKGEDIPPPVFKVGDIIHAVDNILVHGPVLNKRYDKEISEWRYLVKELGLTRETDLDFWKDPRPQIIGDDSNCIDWKRFCEENPLEAAQDIELPKYYQTNLFKKFKKEKNVIGLGSLFDNKTVSEELRKISGKERDKYRDHTLFSGLSSYKLPFNKATFRTGGGIPCAMEGKSLGETDNIHSSFLSEDGSGWAKKELKRLKKKYGGKVWM